MLNFRTIGRAIYEMRPIRMQIAEHDALRGICLNQQARVYSELELKGRLQEAPGYVMKNEGLIKKIDADIRRLTGQLLPRRNYYRGMSAPSFDDYEGIQTLKNAVPGQVICPERGYTFVTSSSSIADEYTNMNGQAAKVLMKIKTPIGTRVSRDRTHEKEVIFPRNAQFEVLKKKKRSNGTIDIVLKYILPGS